MAAAPSPTNAGVLGIALTIGIAPPVASPMALSVTPAATDNSRLVPTSATCEATVNTTSGFVAIIEP